MCGSTDLFCQILLFSTPICFSKRSICSWKKTNLLFIFNKCTQQIGCFKKQIGFNKSVISKEQIDDFIKNKSVISDYTNILKRPICFLDLLIRKTNLFSEKTNLFFRFNKSIQNKLPKNKLSIQTVKFVSWVNKFVFPQNKFVID